MEKVLHFVIHPRPAGSTEYRTMALDDVVLQVVAAPQQGARFDCTFEQVAARFQQLPRMFLEPDGAFVWINREAFPPRQVDGNLVDDGERLVAVEVKSNCDERTLDHLLRALGWPDQHVLFQLVRHGVYLEEAEFRSYFVRSPPAGST